MVHEAHEQRRPPPRRRVRSAGYLLGAGLAGLLDGILFHDLLGWHHFLDVPGRAAMVSDGLFHLAMWTLTVVAVALLWRARVRFAEPAAGAMLVGSALVGAGALQAVDGLVDHLLLHLHWLHPGPHALAWEVGDQAASWLVIASGALLMRRATLRREGALGIRRGRHRGRPMP